MPATDLELDEVQSIFSTNVIAVMDIIQTFLPLLLAARGTIANIGSVAGLIPFIWGAAYNASKAALHSYADTLRVELAPFGVHVVTVVTGGVKSNIARIDRNLKPGSLWEGFEEQYQHRQTYSQKVGQDTAAYARDVVGQLMSCRGYLWNRNEIWAGGRTGLVVVARVIDRWVPGGIWRILMPRMAGLGGAGKKNKDA